MPPPPSTDVASQMRPPAPGGGGFDLAALLGGATLGGGPDIAIQVMTVEPLLHQLAMEAPTLAPDVDQLLGEMKERMSGPGIGLAALAGPAMMGGAPPGMGQDPSMDPAAVPAGPPAPMASQPPPMEGPPDPMMAPEPPQGGGPISLPEPPPPMGLMDIAMQLEAQLPAIGAADPTLLQNIQYFVAKMRDEVSKIVSGSPDNQASSMQKNNPAPTDATINQLPVRA